MYILKRVMYLSKHPKETFVATEQLITGVVYEMPVIYIAHRSSICKALSYVDNLNQTHCMYYMEVNGDSAC